ncbi:MAG: SUMF1/EgtB/PvdO family nonheme iron enzyme [Muribaculaceae bacterium]|nr:SUMF1/EgtB/PvdO family nonheme iron enzyme [Muribaculaceae bacterium]
MMREIKFMGLAALAMLCAGFVSCSDDEDDETQDSSVRMEYDGKVITDLEYTDMVAVEGGTFTMGATSEQGSSYYYNELPAHQVTVSDFYIGKYEVTQQLWVYVMTYSGKCADGSTMSAYALEDPWLGYDNPSEKYGLGDYYPAYYVSHDEVVYLFLPRLNRITGREYRLPTEAEWEYAARGGNKSKGYVYSGSDNIGDVAFYISNTNSTNEVGLKQPNELGIYDMSGNVWEWCSDWFGEYASTPQTNPTGPSTGSCRVHRGGAWDAKSNYCRVSRRNDYFVGSRFSIGFRLALSK